MNLSISVAPDPCVVCVSVALAWVVLCAHAYLSPCLAVHVAGGSCAHRSQSLHHRSVILPRLVGGGVTRSNVFTHTILDAASVVYMPPNFERGPDLLYCGSRVAGVREDLAPLDSTLLSLAVPLSSLATSLPHRALLPLLRLHHVALRRSDRKLEGVSAALNAHVCGRRCPNTIAMFMPLSVTASSTSLVPRRAEYLLSQLRQYPVLRGSLDSFPDDAKFRYVSGISPVDCRALGDDVVVDIPFSSLVMMLPWPELHRLAAVHGVHVPESLRQAMDCSRFLLRHDCTSIPCDGVAPIFRLVKARLKADNVSMPIPYDISGEVPSLSPPVDRGGLSPSSIEFPPQPADTDTVRGVVRDWCQAFSASEVLERPCAVCARLT